VSISVCHVVQSLDPKAGGPPVIAWNLATAQQRRGNDVRMCAIDAVPHGDSVEPAGSVARCGKIPVLQLPRPAKAETVIGKGATRRRLAEVIRKVDVVHLHGLWDPILRLAALEAQAQRRPYLVLLNGMLDPWSLRQKWLKKRVALTLGYRRLLNAAARLHFGNHDEQRLVEPLGLKARGVIVPNGIDLAETKSVAPGSFRRRFPLLGDHPYVLFLGRLHVKKGLPCLAEAFSILSAERSDVRLVVAGPDEGARQPLEAQVQRLGLADRVHIVGPLYGDEKWAAFTDAACLCLPSHQEGFSIALLESLASSLPVVISEECHFPEVAAQGAGFVVSREPAVVAAALRQIVGNETLRSQMAAAGRRLVETRYTWDKVAEQCDQIYCEVLSEQPARLAPMC
jgi:glycosyltransferase involved in cell wall biosynthesis